MSLPNHERFGARGAESSRGDGPPGSIHFEPPCFFQEKLKNFFCDYPTGCLEPREVQDIDGTKEQHTLARCGSHLPASRSVDQPYGDRTGGAKDPTSSVVCQIEDQSRVEDRRYGRSLTVLNFFTGFAPGKLL
jgi:hypothetical protein